MADTVQYMLEKMIPELEDLERRSLFTRDELRQVVKKRTDFEYMLKRRAALKTDYLNYIQYETDLESERKQRKEAIVERLKEANLRWRPTLSDHAITQRIMFIYERAVRKFRGDLNLWLKYMEFCRLHDGTKRLQKVATRALQLHPDVEGLWVYVAAWEFEQNLNHTAARAIMQQGLRMNPKSHVLWLQYLAMEISYVSKLKARQLLLIGSSQSQETAAINPRRQAQDQQVANDMQLGLAKLDALLVQLSSTIITSAVDAVKDSVELRFKLLEIVDGADFKGKDGVVQKVLEAMDSDFQGNAKVVSAKARRAETTAVVANKKLSSAAENGSIKGIQAAAKVYDAAMVANGSLELCSLYEQHLTERLASLSDLLLKSPSAVPLKQSRAKVEAMLVGLYERANEKEWNDEGMAERHVELLLGNGDTAAALTLAESFVRGRFKAAGKLWLTFIELRCQSSAAEKAEARFDAVKEMVVTAVKYASVENSLHLWRFLMECAAGCHGKCVDETVSLVEEALTRSSSSAQVSELACSVITWLTVLKGLSGTRKVVDRILSIPGPSRDAIAMTAAMEAQAHERGDPEALQRMRRIINLGIEVHGSTATDMWLHFCKLLIQVGKSSEAGELYWKAKKVLTDPSGFMAGYQTLIDQ